MPPNSGALGLEFFLPSDQKNIQSYTSSCIQIKFLYWKKKLGYYNLNRHIFKKCTNSTKFKAVHEKKESMWMILLSQKFPIFRTEITGT